MQKMAGKLIAGLLATIVAIAYCDAQQSAGPQNLRQRQMAFLNEIRSFDPQHEVIDRAIFNQANELGIIVNRSVEMQKIPPLRRTLLTKMAEQFPNQDLTVLAYAPTDPPLKLGTAHLAAPTGDMSYWPENH
jgi:hypothetical protein